MPQQDNKNAFNSFTNLYELSKTLRFELKPATGKTEKMLLDNGVFKKDELIAKNYKEAKKWFDKLHQEFIEDTLSKMQLGKQSLIQYSDAYNNLKDNKDADKKSVFKKKIDNLAMILRKEITLYFTNNGENKVNYYKNIGVIKNDTKTKTFVSIKKNKVDGVLFGKEVLGVLRHENKNIKGVQIISKYIEEKIINVREEKNIFDTFPGSTYFKNFQQSRQNFYKDDGTSTAIPTRIIDDNFPKFLDNKIIFEKKYLGKYDDLFTSQEKEIFFTEYFNNCFTQEQIEKYNAIISGLRSKINEKRQKANNKNDLPFFKILFKQILSERTAQETEQTSFIEIVDDNEVFDVLQKFIDENEDQLPQAKKLFDIFIDDQLADSRDENKNFNISQVYISGRVINTISNRWFSDWNAIRSLFIEGDRKKLPDFISLQEIKEKLKGIENSRQKSDFIHPEYKNLYEEENDYYKIFLMIWKKEFVECFNGNNKSGRDEVVGYYNALEKVKRMIEFDGKYTNKKDFCKNKEGKFILDDNGEKKKLEIQKDIIRTYAENALSIYQMMKYFALESGKERNWNTDKLDEDGAFYNPFIAYYQNSHTWQYFNVFRNYLTQKPYRKDKIKLNFENGTLLDGWDENKERANFGIILRKNGKYYLGVMHKNHSNILDNEKIRDYSCSGSSYEKMIYKQMADPKRDFPKGVFSAKGMPIYKPNSEIVDIYKKESFKIGSENFSLENLHKIIDFYKQCIPQHPSWKQFDFVHIKPTQEYQKNIGEFYADIKKNAWKVRFENISGEYIDEKVNNGELYLFEIYNKDFSEKTSGSKNLHTLYWNEIFSAENLKNPIIKLNGQAEIFFRKASLKKEIKEKKKSHDIIKNKRYTENKIFFHCPLTLNFTKDELKKDKKKYKGKADAFSIKVREYLASNKGVNIIGIDRGEKHLAYYSIIDQGGKILDIGSFNKIGGIDYHEKLDKLEKGKANARLTWQTIGQIKEMKKGYVSQVVKRICDLMIDHNAVVVFEDLNVGFKRGRFAIEKQVYQNLELALAKKLNYLVFKDKKRGENGHHTKALQLTPKIDNFKNIYKQCGFMFYIPASYTSAMCPICGFRKNIPTPTENKEKNKEYLKKIDIIYEKESDRFRFSYALKNVIDKKNYKEKSSGYKLFRDVIPKDSFVFYSNVDRLQFQRNKDNRGGEMKWKYPNEELKNIFKRNMIDINNDINKQIQAGNFDDKKLYAPIIYNIRLILQLRNAITKRDGNGKTTESHDFISCPSCEFHSEKNTEKLQKRYVGKEKFEFNGDANGAYNIARKGSLVLKKIAHFSTDESMMENQDLTVTQEEWDKYAMKD